MTQIVPPELREPGSKKTMDEKIDALLDGFFQGTELNLPRKVRIGVFLAELLNLVRNHEQESGQLKETLLSGASFRVLDQESQEIIKNQFDNLAALARTELDL